MKNNKVLIIFIIVLALIILGLLILLRPNISEGLIKYKNGSNLEITEDIFISDVESRDELKEPADYFREAGYTGGIDKISLDTIGEGYIPDVILNSGVSEWYTLSTPDGMVCGFFYEGNFVIEKY